MHPAPTAFCRLPAYLQIQSALCLPGPNSSFVFPGAGKTRPRFRATSRAKMLIPPKTLSSAGKAVRCRRNRKTCISPDMRLTSSISAVLVDDVISFRDRSRLSLGRRIVFSRNVSVVSKIKYKNLVHFRFKSRLQSPSIGFRENLVSVAPQPLISSRPPTSASVR